MIDWVLFSGLLTDFVFAISPDFALRLDYRSRLKRLSGLFNRNVKFPFLLTLIV